MGIVRAVCISEQKGTAKKNVGSARLIENWGLENDAHAGKWHRQVSLLSFEEVEKFRARGAKVEDGAFGENLLVEGYDLKTLPVGTVFRCGEVVLELTQIGKKCHSECEIYKMVGDCIMPREGVFAVVLRGGTVQTGDTLEVVAPNGYTAAVLTASDKGSRGEREDISGPAAAACLKGFGYAVKSVGVLADDEDAIYKELVRLVDEEKVDAVFTTGGTGLSARDHTPEATLRAATRQVPGIAEAIRWNSLQITPRAMLSRAVSVMRNRSLIINLPGSPKAVRECLDYVLPALSHGMGILTGREGECGSR
ncbi:MAG: MOSC domain-containing protein [Lachnospiraceae bacterium]|nr:MOSC domain-containing protein [Lachnospiraceae bacterium]